VITLVPLFSRRADEVEALLDRAFEPGRHARTAYKVRGDAAAIPNLSFAATEGDTLLGSIQCWPVTLTLDGETRPPVPLVMIGPVAVEPARQRDGIGRQLMSRALNAAADDGADAAMMLIGDPEYYGRFGFSDERTADWRLPGPVERRRLLARGAAVPATPGLLGPALVSGAVTAG